MWQDTMDKYRNKRMDEVRNELSQAQVGSVVLRWKRALLTSQDVYGLSGFRTWVTEQLDGRIDNSAQVDPGAVVVFWPDRFHVGWALVPVDTRNLDVLAACSLDEQTPWTIDDATQEVRADIASRAEAMKPKAPQEPVKAKEPEQAPKEPTKAPVKAAAAKKAVPGKPMTIEELTAAA